MNVSYKIGILVVICASLFAQNTVANCHCKSVYSTYLGFNRSEQICHPYTEDMQNCESGIHSICKIDASNELKNADNLKLAQKERPFGVSNTSILINEELNTSHVNESVADTPNKTLNSSGNLKQAICNETKSVFSVEDVQLLNGTTLQNVLQTDSNITSKTSSAQCILVYFFSQHCPFSVQGSSYVNALARSLPNIPIYGIDSIEFHSLNSRYGVMGTPSLVLFHNGIPMGRYNASEYSTAGLISFIHHFTNQQVENITVTSHDFKDTNLPTKVVAAFPLALYMSWLFLLVYGGYLFFTSQLYAKLSETILNNWREAEAQHAHVD